MKQKTIAVAIVEDNAELRDGLSQLVGSAPDMICSGVFGSGEAFLSRLPELDFQVVLMDIGLPAMSGIECARRTKLARPEVEVLMLTVFEDESKIFDSLCAGASGYLLKKTPPAKILDGIRDIGSGGVAMSGKVARKVLGSFRVLAPVKKSPQLSERESEVLVGLANGLSYKMIGEQCGISVDTVRSHVRHIYDKLHVHSSIEAINAHAKNMPA